MDKLLEIMDWKRQEIEHRIRPVREIELCRLGEGRRKGLSFYDALARPDRLSVIAEIKRKSPSAGEIKQGADAVEQARRYYNAGADCLSILTDEKYFGGKLADLWDVTDFMDLRDDPRPCLRKDFMVHPIQVIEAAEAGARAVLIIVRALTDEEIKVLYDSANMAGLDSIFEIHSEPELERALNAGAKIVGVNNRDLSRFVTDIGISERLIPQFPEHVLPISESGIHTIEDAIRAREAGAKAVLIGEALMKSDDPDQFMQELQQL